MSSGAEKKETFSAADMKALCLLAVSLGAVAIGMLIVARDTASQVLSIGLVIAMMLICPLVIFGLRRWKSSGK